MITACEQSFFQSFSEEEAEKDIQSGLITSVEAADMLGVDDRTVKNLIANGAITGAVKYPKKWLVPRRRVLLFFAQHQEEVARGMKEKERQKGDQAAE